MRVVSALGVVQLLAQEAPMQGTEALEHFEKKVRPVLAQRCYSCHSSSLVSPQGGLTLDSVRGIRRGGNSGPLFQPGNIQGSLLLRALRHTDKNLKMPPGKPLGAEAVADFESWIASGAMLPADKAQATARTETLWSLREPRLVEPSPVRADAAARNVIDRYILNKLEAKHLTLSPEADKRTLIRRATYDLTGLPATASEVEQFIKDASPNAYEMLIDRLLASPRYGERWGRHWLDVARYADSVNDSVNSGQRYAWSYTYRDWVIAAVNEDLPYDKFLLYQVAADLAPGVESRHLAALGFLSLGRAFPNSYPETVDDRIDAVTRGMLGLTVSCARCHDHKYDPIPTKDYYSLYSIFSNIREPKELPLISETGPLSPKQARYQQRLERIRQDQQAYRVRRNTEMVAFFKTQIAEYLIASRDAGTLTNPEIEELVRDRQLNLYMLGRWRKHLQESKTSGEPVFRLWHAASNIADKDWAAKWPAVLKSAEWHPLITGVVKEKSVESLRELAILYASALSAHDRAEPHSDAAVEELRAVLRGPSSPVDVPVTEFESICTEGDRNNMRSLRGRYNAMLVQAAYDGFAPRAMSIEDVPNAKPAHVFIRGNPNNPGALAPPHFLSCLGGGEDKPFNNGQTRLELAQAIVDPQNPLTARVAVNRVWMHHFGAGLVRTPSDFGFRGDPPSHPELLDYLALKFVQTGWSLKKLHREIMTSAVYRQASSDNEAARKIDPENQLWWRMNRRRLEIEGLRDSALAAAGRLDLTSGGVPFPLSQAGSVPRRTVYGFIERGRVPGLLSAFDFASPDQHAPMRYITTVPQQALFFLNSPFIAEQASFLSARPEVQNAPSAAGKIRLLYRAVLNRSPEPLEVDAGTKYLAQATENKFPAAERSPWKYGIGKLEMNGGRVESFTEFGSFVNDQWQGAPVTPAPVFGKAVIRAGGGEPGDEPHQAVIRRWISPASGKLTIEGTLRHGQGVVPYGDGVRGRLVSSRHGELASWNVNGSAAETKLSGITVDKGDTLDFVVEARSDPENDGFGWAPTIKLDTLTWSASKD
ncbi:MAG TPA: PSD1 and planctomycete cytochrome C domain-containing protein, partial [Bryobacteraceae bacterium]|nr:PSD1 and planctomycete cytochrome C domain-containing protein [Bryobacteraceae bacterium]